MIIGALESRGELMGLINGIGPHWFHFLTVKLQCDCFEANTSKIAIYLIYLMLLHGQNMKGI